MLQIGQIRTERNSVEGKTYLIPLPINPSIVYSRGDANNTEVGDSGINDVVFQDFALEYNFQKDTTYYLIFAVQRYPDDPAGRTYGNYDTATFSLILCKYPGDENTGKHTTEEKLQTIERNLTLTPYQEGVNEPWQQFTIVFTPVEEFQYLWFHVNRIGYDYIFPSDDGIDGKMGRSVFRYTESGASTNTIEFSTMTKKITIKPIIDAKEKLKEEMRENLELDEQTEIQVINTLDTILNNDFAIAWKGEDSSEESTTTTINIIGEFDQVKPITFPNFDSVDQIGIQSRPGSLFIVNHEPIYLGRSGIYELNNGTKIVSVGVAAPGGTNDDNIPHFIIDYAKNIVEEEE